MRNLIWALAVLCTITIIVSLAIIFASDQQNPPIAAQFQGSAAPLVAVNKTEEEIKLDAHINKILIPRVSGTPGNIQVREYIINELKADNYDITLDEFTDSTPIGNVKFANIIASSNPNACRQLVLACHYDSKLMEGFLGAIDSAVPCAMLLVLAKKFNRSFRDSGADNLGLKFIFFDGEEAFVEWSATDSLYGSRHLAEKWHKQAAPLSCPTSTFKNELSRIELFILLDLIGASDSSFVIYNTKLKSHYETLRKLERQYLIDRGSSQATLRRETSFKNRFLPIGMIEDDHVPFMKRGVPILSLLSHPFPSVWHTINDNYDAIDFPKTIRILNVLDKFVANYSRLKDD